jgi:hypothetical protein
MNSNELKRVVFYSKEDMAAGSNLRNAEELLKNFQSTKNDDINVLLELYHVKLYFDNDLFLLTWDESTKTNYKEIVNQAFDNIKQFMLSITDDDIINLIETLEFSYKKSFWELVNNLQIYKQISNQIFSEILDKFPFQVNHILACKNIVKHFDKNITAFLSGYEKSAELLLAEFEEQRRSNSTRYYFPKTLSYEDKEEIISKYLEAGEPNLNYVRLIENSNSNELKLSGKIKLRARKKDDELSDKYFDEEHSWKIGVQVTLDKDQQEPVRFETQDHIFKASYGENYLNVQSNNITLFRCFTFPFFYIDDHGLITLISKQNEMDTLETIFMKSKNEYEYGVAFQRKSHLAYIQIVVFNHYLNQNNNSIEKVIDSFIHEYLNACFEIKNIRFSFPTTTSTYLEKIRALAPEFESLLKQYQYYVDDGNIDFELLQFSSPALRLSEIKSVVDKKYLYANDNKINHLKYHFFSDQSMLYYIELYKEKYHSLYDLLTKENVELSNFEDYQKGIINYLIKEDYLYVDERGFIKIKKLIFMSLIGDIHKDEVLNYLYYPEEARAVIDEMLLQNLLISKSTLFSEQEISYFNFYLNKKEFTNGLDLRNKYLHGTNTTSEKEHEYEYYILLKLIILALLKIEGDLVVGNKCIE